MISTRTYVMSVSLIWVVLAGLTVWVFRAEAEADRAEAVRLVALQPNTVAALHHQEDLTLQLTVQLAACQKAREQDSTAHQALIDARRADLERYVAHLIQDVKRP